jgi:hypothetical protein
MQARKEPGGTPPFRAKFANIQSVMHRDRRLGADDKLLLSGLELSRGVPI